MLTTLIFFPYHLFSRIREQELRKGFRSECYLTIMLFDKCRLKQEIRLIRCFSHITHSEDNEDNTELFDQLCVSCLGEVLARTVRHTTKIDKILSKVFPKKYQRRHMDWTPGLVYQSENNEIIRL